jgi:hypothetical protein
MSGARNGDPPLDLEALADQVAEHIHDAIDWNAVFRIEQMLWFLLKEDPDGARAMTLVGEAFARAAVSPSRYGVTDVPYGVTKEEAKAVAFDDGCPLCRLDAQSPPEPEHDHDGDCELCDDMAREWRAQNADALRRYGTRKANGTRKPAASRN